MKIREPLIAVTIAFATVTGCTHTAAPRSTSAVEVKEAIELFKQCRTVRQLIGDLKVETDRLSDTRTPSYRGPYINHIAEVGQAAGMSGREAARFRIALVGGFYGDSIDGLKYGPTPASTKFVANVLADLKTYLMSLGFNDADTGRLASALQATYPTGEPGRCVR